MRSLSWRLIGACHGDFTRSQGCRSYGESKGWSLIFLFTFVACILAGAIMLALGVPQHLKVSAIDLDTDFPIASNTLPAPGFCEVTAVYSRPVLRRKNCGKDCEKTVCYDDYTFECSWSGGPTSGPFTVVPAQIDWKLKGCHESCDKFGGWRLINTSGVPSGNAYAHSLVEKGFYRDRFDGECEKGTESRDGVYIGEPYHANYRKPLPEENGDDNVFVGAMMVLRVPANGASGVDDIFSERAPTQLAKRTARTHARTHPSSMPAAAYQAWFSRRSRVDVRLMRLDAQPAPAPTTTPTATARASKWRWSLLRGARWP